jgi:hypothetical protein
VKGQAEVFPKPGKTFDPALIPKAIRDAGFSAAEIVVEADGTLVQDTQGLQLAVPGLSHSFVLSGGPRGDALAKRADLLGKEIRVTGKLRVTNSTLPSELTVEDFQPKGK